MAQNYKYSFQSTKTNYSAQSTVDTTNQNTKITNMFTNTKDFKDVTTYKLMRGVPDFGSLVQFNPYESGYAAFIICQMPRFIELLAKHNASYEKLMKNWAHIIEYEFKSFDGLEDMSADTIQLGDDLNSINVISRVNLHNGPAEFSLSYDEKSGSPLTKFAKLYLTGIKDPKTQVKSYHGLVHANLLEPGFENEVFTFLYIATDNTMREVEAAYLLVGCQLNSANLDMYNYTKGDIQKREITVKFSGYPIQSSYIDAAASDMLKFLLSTDAGARQIIINSNDYAYTGINSITKTMKSYNSNITSEDYPSIGNVEQNAEYTTSSYYTDTSDFNG